MAKEINYYEILLNIENQLYKISSYAPEAERTYAANLLNLIRLEVVNYIYSIPILKKRIFN